MSRKHLGYAALVSLCIGAAAPGAIAAQQKGAASAPISDTPTRAPAIASR